MNELTNTVNGTGNMIVFQYHLHQIHLS